LGLVVWGEKSANAAGITLRKIAATRENIQRFAFGVSKT